MLESIKDYIKVHTIQQTIITREKISSMEKGLPNDVFIRVHRSFIVSIPKITAFTNEYIEIGEQQVPIGRSYKNLVIKSLSY